MRSMAYFLSIWAKNHNSFFLNLKRLSMQVVPIVIPGAWSPWNIMTIWLELKQILELSYGQLVKGELEAFSLYENHIIWRISSIWSSVWWGGFSIIGFHYAMPSFFQVLSNTFIFSLLIGVKRADSALVVNWLKMDDWRWIC